MTSSAVSATNPEVMEARARKIPVIQRAEMLAELMRLKYGIAVAGMHGETTTTSMIAAVLAGGGLDPTVVVGGRVDALGSNARLGNSQYLVAEADESDRSFLKLSPVLGVVTNLDREHMDCYRDMEDVEAAFVEFMDRCLFMGRLRLVLIMSCCGRCCRGCGGRFIRMAKMWMRIFGCRFWPKQEDCHSCFEVNYKGLVLGQFRLHVPGRHNVLNATAAVAVGVQLGVAPDQIAAGLESFRGVDRRFQVKGVVRGVTVVDDYGHHPTEIMATLRGCAGVWIWAGTVLFQPHRFTRTRDLMTEFAGAFGDADVVKVLDIYAASEESIAGVTAEALVKEIGREDVSYAASVQDAVTALAREARDGDVIRRWGQGVYRRLGLCCWRLWGRMGEF